MLTNDTIKKTVNFCLAKPHTIQEIAHYLGVNWRTADRYVERIVQETGDLATRTFREGTRGALKIVYYTRSEKISSTEFQERLFEHIIQGRKKEDFSPFDIYQYVDQEKRSAFLEVQKEEFAKVEQDIVTLFEKAEKSIMIFSGNLSWANVSQGKKRVLDVLKDAAKRSIAIKVLTRIDIASMRNIAKLREINEELGKEAVEIRHAEQPLRCVLVDTKHSRFKETKSPENYKSGELPEKTFIFYDVFDEEWNEWLQKVFWNMFSTATPAIKRLETLESIQKMKLVGFKNL